ncbi:MAG TPA: CDP-alcohol phosphatidyltransferase family protein [Bryobacteraceae bacterium]|jgi:phosphatidylglycerophosphate synthase|nr:CDP-alcohol phosphatidyltransferase family protein [Bryobacteraceae bacterium]
MPTASSKPHFKDANRAQLSLLAPLEKRTLLWLAARMPPSVNSDHLTVLGFLSLIGAGLSYWYARTNRVGLVLVIGFLVLNWVGDSLDGTLARYRQRLRPRYGFYVDHVVDMFGTFFLLGGLGLSGYMSFPLAMALVIAYFMLSIEVYLTTYTIGTFHLSFWKFSPTELRILLAIGNIALLVRGGGAKLAGQQFLLFDVGGAVGLVGMAVMLVISTIKHTVQLYNEERLP